MPSSVCTLCTKSRFGGLPAMWTHGADFCGLRRHQLAAQHSRVATSKLREGGGPNAQRDVRLGMDHCFTSCSLPSLTCLHIERVSDIGRESCCKQGLPSFRRRDVDVPDGPANGLGDLFCNLCHAQRFWPGHLVAFSLMP